MEAPEKIYLHPDEDGEVFGKPWSSIPFNKHNVEYTRTDVLIEKACVKLKKLMYDDLMFQGRLHREEVIDNFVGDFKRYIEE